MFHDADPNHRYTRANAIRDGTLVDVTRTAREVGFRVPVAVTQTVWGDCVSWRHRDSIRLGHQDEAGRLWDVARMAWLAARSLKGSGRVSFTVLRVPRDSETASPVPVTLLLDLGPGDDGKPVVTIGFAEDF
jgi:hypothetical protein